MVERQNMLPRGSRYFARVAHVGREERRSAAGAKADKPKGDEP